MLFVLRSIILKNIVQMANMVNQEVKVHLIMLQEAIIRTVQDTQAEMIENQ